MALATDDRLAIDDLAERYAHLVDAGEFERVGDLFLPDATLTTPLPPRELGPVQTSTGRQAIVDGLGKLDGFAVTFHGLAGSMIDETGPGRARGRINCVAHHVASSGRDAEDVVWHLRYDDEYQRVSGDWFIANRAITILLLDVHTVKLAGIRTADQSQI
ncbi:nuclear transport factor 2 family protein [Gordonia neofelifaecis]|uniref:SnoaL-like domain-containing protein n=1 Tax=Gordonia neofelifaecis NRRL B-59395 TaxID=644548 RepID=F1YJB2_9ACTN|nr:nuclear transport factor 2 family protein [Gordonia neofelifaecis]EGD55145.1 hypothetical protein SCNU_09744 [Gordonia neofelifaecis NRRL B-59395]